MSDELVQLRLGLANTSDGPFKLDEAGNLALDRDACPKARPCPQYACRYHLWADDERPGRPHHGKKPPPKVRRRGESCAIDVAERGEQTTEQIADHLGVTPERTIQIEDRALSKLAVVRSLMDHLEEFRPGVGARVRAVYPEQLDAHSVAVVVIVGVNGTEWRTAQAEGGVFVRRKAVPK